MVFTAKTLPLLLLSACARCGQEGDAVPEDSSTVFPDEDGDGYSPFKGDCDDTNPTVHPDAPDPVGDDLDANCDGLDGVAERLSEASSVIMDGSAEILALGTAQASVGDVNGDGQRDLLMLALQPGEQLSGYALLFHGPIREDTQLSDAVLWVGEDEEGGFAAQHLSAAGDLDGDSRADLAIPVPLYTGPNAKSGRVWIVYGSENTGGELEGLSDYIESDVLGAHLGAVVDGRGDLDGDGRSDLLVGATQTGGGALPGLVMVFQGPLRGALRPEDAALLLNGTENVDGAGGSASWAQDVNADGYDDLVVGAQGNPSFGTDTGTAWVIYGPRFGEHSLADADATFNGEFAGGQFGSSVADAGDTNGDGYDDILFGAPLTSAEGNRSGRAWLALGPVEGTLPISSADALFTSAGELDWTGFAVKGAGDINGDGFDDVLISAPQQYIALPERAARIGLFYGPLFGVYNPDDADRAWASKVSADLAGATLSIDGDLTGDQVPDLVVGAPYTYSGEDRTGRVYILGLEP